MAWTRAQAMRTPMFWVIAIGIGVVGLLGTALSFDQVSLLGEHGLTPAQAAANFIPQTIAGLAATLLTGYLADQFSDRSLIIASLSVLTLALAAARYVAPGWSAIGYGIAMGVAASSFRVLEATSGPAPTGPSLSSWPPCPWRPSPGTRPAPARQPRRHRGRPLPAGSASA